MLWPDGARIDGCTEKCQKCCELRYSHYECAAAFTAVYTAGAYAMFFGCRQGFQV
jgi:hypothetical protein